MKKSIDEILAPWIRFIHSEYDGTSLLENELAVVEKAKEQLLEALLGALRDGQGDNPLQSPEAKLKLVTNAKPTHSSQELQRTPPMPNPDDSDKLNEILLTLYLGENFITDYTKPILQKQFDNPALAKARASLRTWRDRATTKAQLDGRISELQRLWAKNTDELGSLYYKDRLAELKAERQRLREGKDGCIIE